MNNQRGASESPNIPCAEERQWFEEQLEKKVDEKIYELKMKQLEKEIADVKQESTNHICKKEDVLNEMKTSIENFKKVKIGTIVAVLVLVFAAVAQYYDFKNTLDNTSAALAEIKVSIDQLKSSQQNLKDEIRTKGEDLYDLKSIKISLEKLVEIKESEIKQDKKRRKR
jgi:hypothetical protein